MLKSVIRKAISAAGYSLHKKRLSSENPDSMQAGLIRLQQLGIVPAIVIDLGAAQGTWTQKSLKVWPNAKYELVEPLIEQRDKLDALKSVHSNIDYHLAVAGEVDGETFLNVSPDLDGSGVYNGREGQNARKVPVITIDRIVENVPGSVLIKFDTHGYEVPILKGAADALKRTSALVVEIYGFSISPTCLVFHELCAYLDALGFRLFDVVDIMRRPGDNAFWQADAFYIRKDNPVFKRSSYE